MLNKFVDINKILCNDFAMKKTAIDIYLNYFKGNQSKAARALGVRQQNFWYWLNGKKVREMPVEYVPKAAKIIGKTAHDLMPSIFDKFL